VPKFSLVAPSGARFGSDELRGHVYVASFFFTRCGSICPALMKQMSRLEQRYREDGFDSIRLVSITVDPEHDTPDVLRETEKRYGADGSRWVLLTGTREEIHSLAVDGLKIAVGDAAAGEDGAIDIAHSGKLVLVDAEGGVRGYYDSDDVGLDEAYWRSRHVLKEALAKS
jgi:protein SCO1/2